MGGLSIVSMEDLESTHMYLLGTIVPEHQVLDDFQASVFVMVNNAHAYAQTEQYQYFQEAYAELDIARSLLPKVAILTQRVEQDGFAKDRQAQRQRLIDDATGQLKRLEQAVERGDTSEAGLALQRLDLVAYDVRMVGLTSRRFLVAETGIVVDQIHRSLQRVRSTMVINVVVFVFVVIGILLLVRDGIVHPLHKLLLAVRATERGDLHHTVEVHSRHEVGQLQAGFNAMIASLDEQRRVVEQHTAELESANQQQRRMLDTIQALSVPVLPVLEGVLVLPVVGTVDQPRIEAMTQTLLEAVHEHRARVAILDITGMALHDGRILSQLLNMVQAAELLGTHVMLAGVSAHVAQTIVKSQIQLDHLQSFRSLRDALDRVLSHRDLGLTRG
jgi:anti-anti-sigma regulatory factor/HAMP domain-containing protein